MKSYRAAIIGCGPRAWWHAKAYEQISRGSLVACCNRGEQRLNEFSQQFNLRAYHDAGEMLRNEKPDLVHLVTGPDSRVALMQLIDAAGVAACIVEKPLACEVADWKQLQALEATARAKFALCHQFRWHADLTHCREALASGDLGAVRFMDFSAGMNISGQGTHILDYAMSLNADSPITRVFGAAHGVQEMTQYHPGPDTTMGQVLFANGVYAMWNNGITAPRVGNPDTTWQHVRVAAYADKGHTVWEEFGKWEVVSPGRHEEGRISSMAQWEAGNHAAQAAQINAMFDWIEDDSRPAGANLRRGLHQWQVVLGLYASALWRKPIDIPFDVPDSLFTDLAKALS